MTIAMQPTTYEVECEFYARPVSRGVHLYVGDRQGLYLDDVVYELLGENYSESAGAHGRMRLRIEILESDRG